MNAIDNSHLLAQVQAVSFDLDDTLWHCEPAIVNAEAAAYRWFEQYAPRVVDAHTRESMLEHRMTVYAAHPELHTDVTALRTRSFKILLSEFDYPESLAEEAFDVFYRARSDVVLYDGTHELLEALSERYKLAAITNGNADLDLIGIAHYFDDIRRANVDNPPKPDPYMFNQSLESFSLPAETLLHIGDNPHTDVGGALNSGALAVWFNQYDEVWPEGLAAPQFTVRSLAELQQLLTREHT